MQLRRWTASSMTAILTVLFAVISFVAASRCACGQSSDDDAAPSRLTVTGDFNGDGIPDMAEVISSPNDSGPSYLTISLGQADSSFREVSRLLLGDRPSAIVSGDFNQDGIPDLIVGEDDGALELFLGDGTGKLHSAGEIAQLQSVVSIAVADFNHDGILDIAVSDRRASLVTILLGSGKGVFRAVASIPLRMAGTSPKISAADFNGDGIPDLAVIYGDDDQSSYDVMLGNGNGTFTFSPKLSLVRDPNSYCPS